MLVSFWRNGVCFAESYRKVPPTPFSESELSALLKEDAAGAKWQRLPYPVAGRAALVLYSTRDNRFALVRPLF